MSSSGDLGSSKSKLSGESVLRKKYQEVQKLKRLIEAEEAIASEKMIKGISRLTTVDRSS